MKEKENKKKINKDFAIAAFGIGAVVLYHSLKKISITEALLAMIAIEIPTAVAMLSHGKEEEN